MSDRPSSYHYLSVDVVAPSLALRLGGAHRLSLIHIEPRDLSRLPGGDLIIDADSIEVSLTERLLTDPKWFVRALHGYNVPDRLAGFLPGRGVFVSRRLDERLFRALVGPTDPGAPAARPVLVVGGAGLYRTVAVGRIVLDAKNRPTSVLTGAGGGGANISVATRHLDPAIPVVLFAQLGD